jgi:hypothetical protein
VAIHTVDEKTVFERLRERPHFARQSGGMRDSTRRYATSSQICSGVKALPQGGITSDREVHFGLAVAQQGLQHGAALAAGLGRIPPFDDQPTVVATQWAAVNARLWPGPMIANGGSGSSTILMTASGIRNRRLLGKARPAPDCHPPKFHAAIQTFIPPSGAR